MTVREFPLKGFRVADLNVFPDERGFFAEIMKLDSKDLHDGKFPEQASLSYSQPGIVRGWHRHLRGQNDYFCVVQGQMKVVAWDGDPASPTFGQMAEADVSERRLQIVRVPGHHWHAIRTTGASPSLTVYFVTNQYDPRDPDELRMAWDDPRVVPTAINGRTNDPRVGKPWRWDHPPHK